MLMRKNERIVNIGTRNWGIYYDFEYFWEGEMNWVGRERYGRHQLE
jgi:hypothetical protein